MILPLAIATGLYWVTRGYLKTPYDPLFDRHGSEQEIDPNLLRAIGRAESNFNPAAVNVNADGSRDVGVMQINERTADRLGVERDRLKEPATSIGAAARLLRSIRSELGSTYTSRRAISAYNVGSPRVLRDGIVNPSYVARVETHRTLYTLGGLFA